MGKTNFDVIFSTFKWFSKRTCRLYHARLEKKLFCENEKKIKKVNKQCLLDTPRTVRVSEKTWQVIVRTRRP